VIVAEADQVMAAAVSRSDGLLSDANAQKDAVNAVTAASKRKTTRCRPPSSNASRIGAIEKKFDAARAAYKAALA